MYIEIMYALKGDGSLHTRIKVPIEEIGTLPRFGVLAIAMTHEGILCGRAWGRFARDLPEGLAYGTDRYAYVTTTNGNWYLDCWDDVEQSHSGRSLADPNGPQVLSPAAPRRHSGEASITFVGESLPSVEWEDAKKQVDQYMGVPR